MITKPTVFILGAGASCPYGFPTAKTLRENICQLFSANSVNYFRARNTEEPTVTRSEHEAKQFTYKFNHSSTKSIDLFLARQPALRGMGKMAIVFRILEAEKNSQFREDMSTPEHDWYSFLFDKMTENLTKPDDYQHFSEKNNVSFITFNYDRSLEHFLYESLLYSYQPIDRAKTKEQIDSLDIIHVFGQVAGLDWQDLNSKVKYREDINAVNVQELAKNIRIIYEEEENPALEKAKHLVRDAKRIYFLGFGYRPENIELLGFPNILAKQGITPRPAVYGTTLNLEDEDIRTARGRIGGQDQRNDFPRGTDCLSLLRNTPPLC